MKSVMKLRAKSDLLYDRRKVGLPDWMSRGALSVLVVANWVRYVASVCFVEVVRIAGPAGREHDLSSHRVWAIVLEEVVALVPRRIAVMAPSKVLADVRDGSIVWVAGVVDSAQGTASDHLQAFGKGLHGFALLAALKIVDIGIPRDG